MKQTTSSSLLGRLVCLSLAVLVVVGLSYGALKFWSKPERAFPANVPGAGESIIIPIEGMSCSACVARVKKAMKGTEGVSEANVNLEKGEVEIRYESAKNSPEKLAATINGLGYKAGSPRAKGSGP